MDSWILSIKRRRVGIGQEAIDCNHSSSAVVKTRSSTHRVYSAIALILYYLHTHAYTVYVLYISIILYIERGNDVVFCSMDAGVCFLPVAFFLCPYYCLSVVSFHVRLHSHSDQCPIFVLLFLFFLLFLYSSLLLVAISIARPIDVGRFAWTPLTLASDRVPMCGRSRAYRFHASDRTRPALAVPERLFTR